MLLEIGLIKIKSLDGQICRVRWRFKFITVISIELLVISIEKKRCKLCGADGHTYKKCPELSVPTAAAEAGPSGNPTDGSAPPTRIRRI